MWRSSIFRTTVLVASLALGLNCTYAPTPAAADKRGIGNAIGTGIGIGIGIGILNELSKLPNPKAQPEKGKGGGSTPAGRGSAPERTETTEDRAADARNHAAQQAEFEEIRRTERLEKQRNVASAIRSFVLQLETWHRWVRENGNANVKVSSGVNINQVTDGEVRKAVETAYKSARLFEFDKLAGELWTRDRLMVRILEQSKQDLEDYFRGVGVKGVSMSDLDQVFEKSAKRVYAQALQVSEMIGVSHSFARFIRIIFEQSDRTDESLWTIGADGHYDRLVAGLVDSVPRQTLISEDQALASDPQGIEREFLFRFRARRVLYDCMSSRYADMVSGKAGALEISVQTSSGGTSRGAKLDEGSQQRPVGGAAARPAGLGQPGNIWERMLEIVRANCRDPLTYVVNDAKDGKIQPRPARWDSAGTPFELLERPHVTPLQGGSTVPLR